MKLQDMIIATVNDGKERNMNRRMNLGFGEFGDLRSCWRVSYDNDILTLSHWGTDILVYDCKGYTLISSLITSKSDADGIQLALDYIADGLQSHYYPSKDYGTIEDTRDHTNVYQG
jgi:hypothetical protein